MPLTVVLEKTPERPLSSKEIKLVNLKGDQPSIFTGRTDIETEPVFWSSDVNRRLTGEVLELGKIEGRRRKEHQMMRWPKGITLCNESELGQIPGNGEGQRSLACCSPWGCKESEMTGRLNRTI